MRRHLLILLLATGCSFEDYRRGERCEHEDQCGIGLVCQSGLCVSAPDQDVVLLDAEPLDAEDARSVDRFVPDARPDRTVDLALDAAIEDMAPPLDVAIVDAALPLPSSDPELDCVDDEAVRCWAPTDDSFVNHIAPAQNYGQNALLRVRSTQLLERHVLLRFSLRSFIDRQRPTSCELRLHLAYGAHLDDHPLYYSRHAPTWSEQTVSWSNRPSDIGQRELWPVNKVGDALSFDVSAWMSAALREAPLGQGSAISFHIRGLENRDFAMGFHSKQAVRPEDRPSLVCRFLPTP